MICIKLETYLEQKSKTVSNGLYLSSELCFIGPDPPFSFIWFKFIKKIKSENVIKKSEIFFSFLEKSVALEFLTLPSYMAIIRQN